MFGQRGKIGTETLLKIVLVLLIVILIFEVVGAFVHSLIGVGSGIITLILVILILLYLLDEI